MIDNADHLGVSKTGNGLAGLVVVGEDHLLRIGALLGGLNGIEQTRSGKTRLGEQLRGLGGKRAERARLVLVAKVLDLVQQLGEHHRGHDGVVVGILVSEDENVGHGFLHKSISCRKHRQIGDDRSPWNTVAPILARQCARSWTTRNPSEQDVAPSAPRRSAAPHRRHRRCQPRCRARRSRWAYPASPESHSAGTPPRGDRGKDRRSSRCRRPR